ncbi:hypothetical protein M0811_10388 [Anaeramoeba ignava]|uniref:Uncharacterized protein n=1 Tax=Anaeramoeba ignava TaxID=1746090 RepID=A0A9Q0LEP5_ANAIG|nr:hypothetical protein M0811_10388 [Anaeramoeba ignava]
MKNLFTRYGNQLFQKCDFDYDKKLWNKGNSTREDKQQMVEDCQNFFEQLFELEIKEFKVLIAIDEYNVLYREQFKDSEHILNIFKNLPDITSGIMIASLSSSFYQNKIPEIDFQEFGVKTTIYTKSEFKSIFEWKRKEGKIPQHRTTNFLEKFTNKVPRVLDIVSTSYRNWKKQSSHALRLINQFILDCIEHYKKKVNYVLNKIKQIKDHQQIKQEIELPTLLCLNGNITYLPEFWELSGLFHIFYSNNSNDKEKENEDEDEMELSQTETLKSFKKEIVPICEWVKEAILEIFKSQGFSYINILCQLDLKLDGIKTICFEWIRKVYKIPLENISIGDLIVCYKSHSVVDFVCLSKNEKEEKQLFYFQVSILDYPHHKTRVDSLFKRNFKPTNQQETSILEYYSNLSRIELDNETLQLIQKLSEQQNNTQQPKNEFSPDQKEKQSKKQKKLSKQQKQKTQEMRKNIYSSTKSILCLHYFQNNTS